MTCGGLDSYVSHLSHLSYLTCCNLCLFVFLGLSLRGRFPSSGRSSRAGEGAGQTEAADATRRAGKFWEVALRSSAQVWKQSLYVCCQGMTDSELSAYGIADMLL